jgi:hypothetical protein
MAEQNSGQPLARSLREPFFPAMIAAARRYAILCVYPALNVYLKREIAPK